MFADAVRGAVTDELPDREAVAVMLGEPHADTLRVRFPDDEAVTEADLAALAVFAGEHVGLKVRPVLEHSDGHEQAVGAPAPAGQKEPAGQIICVAEVEPRGQ